MTNRGRKPNHPMVQPPHYGSGPVAYNRPPISGPPVPGALPMDVAAPSNPEQRDYAPYAGMGAMRPPPFDQFLIEDFPEDPLLTKQLLDRHQQISQSGTEQAAIQSLVTRVSQILDRIVVAPDSFTPVSIEEVREVGSFKKGTMLTKSNTADLVVILKSLPTPESVNALGQKIVQELKTDPKEVFGCVNRDYGCEIAGTQAVIRLLITILPHNAKLLEPDLHLPERCLQSNMATIRHARWFEEHATHSSVKVLIKVLKDIKKRYDGFKSLNVWCIELLSHYCVMHTRNRTPLPLAQAFKRFFHILATGMLLPTSPALVDPCDPAVRINYSLTLDDMDNICSTSQTLLRVIWHGGAEAVLGMDGKTVSNVASELSVWNNVVVTPLEKAYSAEDMDPYYGDDVKMEDANGDQKVPTEN